MFVFQSFRTAWSGLFAIFLTCASPAYAQIETAAQYAYMIDYDTGAVLLNKGGEEPMHPSSMTKMMTSYIVYDQIHKGKLTMDSTFPVSEKAWKMGGSKMFVHVGDLVPLRDLVRGIDIQSGNDACIVVAEGIAGSEEAFATMMNETAKKLGMTSSHFVNATGWPDEGHIMTAKDLTTLAKHLIHDFPEEYKIYAETEFTYNGITQPNRNRLLGSSLGVDGVKTGHTDVAGYGITLSAKDPVTGRRVIAVVNGTESDNARMEEGAKVLSYGLKAFENKTLIAANTKLTDAPVWFGDKERVGLNVQDSFIATMPKASNIKPKLSVSFNAPLSAPIKQGDKVAELTLTLPDAEPVIVPLVAAENVEKAKGFTWLKALFTQYLAI